MLGATLLITGGTGSFGRAFTECAIRQGAKRVIILSRDEVKQGEMAKEFSGKPVEFFLGDVRDKARLDRALGAKPDIVIHTAALKQVPRCEYDPDEAIKTNVLGTYNLIHACLDAATPPERVVMISSDKAVNPTNLYGSTKLCAERMLIQANSYSGGRAPMYSVVRYGNVLGSRGSVLELFRTQKALGLPLSVTDRNMTRFWMTLEFATFFVARCLVEMEGGEIFVPKLHSSTMAVLIDAFFSGCAVVESGVRPGEKMHETLISEDEARHCADVGDFYVVWPEFHSWTCDMKWTQYPKGHTLRSDSAHGMISANFAASLFAS